MATPRNLLRATQVQIYGIASVLYMLCSFEQHLRVIASKLNHQWPISKRRIAVKVIYHGIPVQLGLSKLF
jgi:hypothetical protein